MRRGRVVLFEAAGKDFRQETFEVRSLQRGELLVKNRYTTICGSDLHTFCGVRKELSPTVLGHEIVGEILELGPEHPGVDMRGNPLAVGDLITWTIFSSEPDSWYAHNGMPQKADKLFKYGHALAAGAEIFHGGMGQYCMLREHTTVLKIPAGMPLAVAATLNCSTATVAGALRVAGDIRGKNILITGMGHLGITCAAMCKSAGAALVIGADITPGRLATALQFGADKVINLKEDAAVIAALLQDFPRKGIDVVFDMSGSPDAMELGLSYLATGGIAVWIGAVFSTRPLQINPESVIRRLITIKGLHNYNFEDFNSAMTFLENNWQQYPFEQAIEKEFELHEAQQAFEYAVQEKPLRVGLRIGHE
ncbi:zinc-binding dehydrogenase [Chitinophaga sp. sic0106]|uniref:zinc-binding dehydrogenase n=1 Tax=Chitinophaga sp. sic0106 TaxID=2854785 RepID=UPI001C47AA4B|nr:zinc-binding dehydrogenase [Chitinophaga sp. sic0106]MBV7530370.1 zinc-binding dehydrogenase [Chitinophaga sp. sic0106]